MKLGKQPPVPDARDLRFADYVAPAVKAAPKGFGHEKLVPSWGVLLNDVIGDCEIARQLHSVMLWNATAGRQVAFTDHEAERVYGAVTGYDPAATDPATGDNPTDRGTVMRDSLKYAQHTGVVDAAGVTHRIGAYLAIDPKDTTQLLTALYLCDQVAVGFEATRSAITQFHQRKPWTVVPGSPLVGGHAVELVGRPAAESLTAVTWGQLQRLTFGFYRAYNDEAWAVISDEALNGGKTLEGFDLAALQADLARL